jgi:hypothetical protein
LRPDRTSEPSAKRDFGCSRAWISIDDKDQLAKLLSSLGRVTVKPWAIFWPHSANIIQPYADAPTACQNVN